MLSRNALNSGFGERKVQVIRNNFFTNEQKDGGSQINIFKVFQY